MQFMSFFGWWYGAGWAAQMLKVEQGLVKLLDQFSILQLITTLFAPFRQISAGRARANASLDAKFHIWLDRQFSRLIGAFVRFFTILAGTAVLLVSVIIGGLRIVMWPLLPLLPIIGLLLALTGWVPWQ
ncbi:MAG: hypothetical protein WBP26_01125 [Candidatus Saccharimonadales bacterium]